MNATPVLQKDRIFILDVIRGVALCGILILNIGFFAFSYGNAGFNMNVLNETSLPDIISWYLTNVLVEGSFRALFSMLFGAGAILIISRLSKNQDGLAPADIYYRRIIWLLIFGLINAYVLLWFGDILYTYALCGLFIFPLRNSSPRLLTVLAIFFMSVIMFKAWLLVQDRFQMREKAMAAIAIKDAKKDSLTEEQKGDLQKWESYRSKRKVENLRIEVEKENKKMSGSYSEVWSYLKPLNQKMESTIEYNDLFFDAMLFILFGMAFYKMGLLTGEKPTWIYVSFIFVGYGLGIGEGYFLGHTVRQTDYDFFKCYDTISPLWRLAYQPHRLLVALGHLGLITVLWKSNVFNWLLQPFANVGQMAFTNYLMQSIICTLFFYGYGLNYYGKLARHELLYFVGAVWIFQIIFSAVWLRYFSMGPLEWAWRSLTYWKRQSLQKHM
ncbi:hypothetical protein WSM22_18910 [Cytophagales bacterium WSM2-2]|nr:hypothetical protein WSM22_18910 [Cytophagales bacterium WSM2-2]